MRIIVDRVVRRGRGDSPLERRILAAERDLLRSLPPGRSLDRGEVVERLTKQISRSVENAASATHPPRAAAYETAIQTAQDATQVANLVG